MPSSLIAVIVVVALAAVYAVGDWWWGRWLRRRHPLLSPRQPAVYRQLAREAQERQVREERLNWAVNEVLDETAGRVGGLYEPTGLTGRPVDPWGEALLHDIAHRRPADRP